MKISFLFLLLAISCCFARTNSSDSMGRCCPDKCNKEHSHHHCPKKPSTESNYASDTFNRRRITIRLYYESLCPDTVRFVKNQLHPAIKLLHDYVKVIYIPWGVANSTNFGFGGFKCQHGSKECLGNMIQECTYNYMKASSEKKKADYLLCEMKTKAASKGSYECVKSAGVSENKVRSCESGNEGKELQLASERLTKSLDLDFIPSVTFNGVFNQELQDASMKDFVATLCTELDRPKPCLEHYNRQALRHLMERGGSLSRVLRMLQ